jgi:hypothetical protein
MFRYDGMPHVRNLTILDFTHNFHFLIMWIRIIKASLLPAVKIETLVMLQVRPPLWSSGQSSWLQIRRPGFDSRHYLKKKCSGSGTGCTQPREYKLRSYLIEKWRLLSIEPRNTAGGIRHADHVAPSIRTSWQTLRRQAAVARSV